MCSYVADPARSLCVHRENGSTGMAAHARSPTLHLSTLGFQCLTNNLWIPLSPMAEEDFQRWKSAHDVLRGAPVTLTNQTLSCSRMHRTSAGEHIGMHWWCPVYRQHRENTSHQRTRVRSHTQRAMLHWLRKHMGLTFLVASEN